MVSQVVDSSNSYYTSNGDYRAIYFDKYIAANLYTFRLFKQLAISFGNSIIYSDENVKAAYFIPFLFYKSVDHTLNYGIDNQNSQMFFGISSRLIKNLHLYADIFIDDFSVTRISDKERHNFAGSKIGLKFSNWPIQNVSLTGEYTKTNPVVYKHRVPTLSFESNRFNLGHYLKDNSEETYLSIGLKPFPRATFSFYYISASHGNEYQYIDGYEAELYPVLKNITWRNEQFGVSFIYEIISDGYLYFNYCHSNTVGFDVDSRSADYYLNLFTPKYLQGKKNTITFGLNVGF
jgi:hypothetical protein